MEDERRYFFWKAFTVLRAALGPFQPRIFRGAERRKLQEVGHTRVELTRGSAGFKK
jgi:hypothetical protein